MNADKGNYQSSAWGAELPLKVGSTDGAIEKGIFCINFEDFQFFNLV